MGNFNFITTVIEGVYIIEPKVFEDERGFFMETYQYNDFKVGGIDVKFVQDNHSKSNKGVLRGLHFQEQHPQGKLVRVITGEVFDVAVDIRVNSPTFSKWIGITLSSENRKQLYIPPGFAHGFLVLSDEAQFIYKCTDYYYPHDQNGIRWDDPNINIEWPLKNIDNIILSSQDKKWGKLEI